MKTIFNIISNFTTMRRLNLNHNFLRLTLLILLAIFSITNAWANGSNVTVYATASVQPSSTGRGKVYVGNSQTNSPSYKDDVVSATNSASSSSSILGTTSQDISFECYAQVTTDGYYFKGWSETNSESATALSTDSPYTYSISTNNTTSPGTTKTLYALFVPIAISNPSPVTYNSTSLTETKTWTIDFTHTGGDRQEDFRNATISSTSEDGQWTVTNTQYVNTTTVRVTCTYTANRDQYTNSAGTRTDEAMLSLSSAGGESTGSTTISVQFPEVTISDATGDVALIKDNASDVKSGSVVFPVAFAESIDNFATPTITKTSGEGTWAITSYSYSANTVTINYSHTGSGTYGTRASEATITLSAKTGDASQSLNVTASYPSLAITSAEDSKAYTPSLLTDGSGVATFHVSHADGLSDFVVPTEITPIDEGGTWTIGETTYAQSSEDPSQGTVQVNYTYNSGGYVGTRTAELILSASSGAMLTLTLSGVTEPESTNDVSVTTAGGVTTEYETWAAGLAAANASAGSTLKLLRHVDLTGKYGITAVQGITQTMTLDLNGKTLSGAINGSILNPKTAGKTLTIKDSKTGGRIQNITPDYNGITYGVNISAGTVNLESGTIYAENQKQYNYGTSSVGGTASNSTAVEVRAVRLVAGAKFNMSGGKVEAHGTRAVRAIYQESSNANTTEVNISGGEVYAEAPSYVYGILAYGKVNISGTAQINVKINDELVNGNATYQSSKFDSYTLHRYGYAIYMTAYANKTPSACYFGTLTMTGGTINVENVNKTLNGTSLNAEHTYGIYMGIASVGMGNANGEATDSTNTQKASSIGSIENATINVTHSGVQVYGIDVLGSYNSFNKTTTPFTIKNSTINVTAWQTVYGALADVSIDWSNNLTTYTGTGRCSAGNIELTNTTINATTTGGTGAYCAWASATYGTVADAQANTGARSTGNATYKGEYAVAATLTVNSGTYTASAATSSAYAVGSSDRAKTIRNIRGSISNRDAVEDPVGSLGGNAEAYPELNIHGGNFSATTGTTTAVAVRSGGNTLIDGGTFNAYAGTTTAYGLYVTAGKTVANGVTFPASATTKAYGVYVTGGISDWSLFPYYGEVELNNCNATATARTMTDARAVFVDGTTKVYTQASFDAMKTANNSNYTNYGDYAQVGERSIVGKVTINGGTYSATAETKTAYGIIAISTRVSTNKEAIAYNPLVIRNATVTAKTNTETTAYGVQLGGGGLVENCTISATAGTTTASGVRAMDKTTVIKNSTISAKGTDAVYGLEGYVDASTAHGYCWHGDFDLSEAGTTKVTAESTGATKAYTIFLNAKAVNVASGNFAGDYATAANATINGGTYIAKTNGGTSGYSLALTGTQTKGTASAQPEVLIEGGKFNGATAEVGTTGVIGHVQLKGGYYVHNTNLSKYIPEGYEEFPLPDDRPEYKEGYRYAIEPMKNHGIYVCQIGPTKYKTLEEALQVVTSGQVIYMIANYTMTTPGDYVLPSGATLLIPYKDGTGKGASTAIGNSAETTTSATTPVLFRKLTFGNGVNLICYGTIETSAQQKANGQYRACVGMPSGPYGQIQMDEGSHISMESGSRLNCWGYITGKGTINVKNNATVLEGFQLGDWCGGSNATTLTGSSNKGKAFPITHYFYQSIECPITYRPGAKALGSTHVNMSLVGIVGQDAVPLVGTSDAMFIMDNVNASEDTWVMKDYDETTDYCYWTINSGASVGNLIVNIPSAMSVNSADYILPICSNMAMVLNYGEGSIGQHAVFTPGSKLIINKEGTLVLNNVTVSVLDLTEYTGATIYRASYSPTWGTTNPRSTSVVDAEVFVHGKVDLRGNGGLYTSASGANIHSTNADAGQVLYTTAAQGDKTTYYLKNAATSATAVTVNAAKLRNEDNTYSSTGGTAAGDVWVYVNSKWTKKTKEGCFSVETTDKKHYFIQPSDVVEVNYPAQSNHTYTSVTGNRVFVWDEDCYWWEVETTPTVEGYFKAITPDHNGKYNYYYYDSSAACWKIKTITVTWNINGSTTNYSVGYGTKPEWLGATPTKASSSSNYVWRWDGWTQGSSTEVIDNKGLPIVIENTTFTAHFYEKYYEYNITFKNDDGTILESKNWIAGTTPSYEGTPEKAPSASQTFTFNGTWDPSIVPVSGSATYVAQYDATPRAYTITFLNYDMSLLGTTEVVYNATPTNDTYLAAVAPVITNPYKPDNNAFSFEFSGWRLQGASENGFTQVKGDQIYVAQFTETTKKYLIAFVDDDGETMLHYMQLPYDADIVYDGPDPTTFAANKTNDEWCYTFTGWAPELKDKKVDGPQTYMATYKKRSNLVVDIADWSSSQVTLNTTNWALGGWPYKVNGTIYSSDKRAADRTLTIDYSGNPNEMLTIEVYNANDELYSIHSYTIPYVFATSSTLSSVSTSSVIYVNGGSLTINNETKVNAIYVASCAELIVNSPLTVSKLVLRTKETEAASLENNSTITAASTYYTRQVSDMAYHQFALPLGVSSTDDVFLSSRAACPYGKTWLLKSYSESERAKNGMGAASNWQQVPDKSPIEASVGYELYSGSAFYREFYFPVNLEDVSIDKKVAVGYTPNADAGNAGWNVLCSPLLGKFEQTFDPNNPEDGIKISQWINGQYVQSAPPVIYPAVPFYYQAKATGKSLFFTGDKMIVYAPRNSWNTAVPTQWMQLTIHNQYGDKLDETSIYTHPEKFSMNYESGYDVAKQSIEEGNALIYSELSYGKLAFAAVPDSIAETRIPLTAYVAAEGEYVFSMVESNYLGRLQYVFLHDTQTGLVTDLLERDYAVNLEQGTNAGRFYIQCVFGAEAPEISTGVNHLEKGNNKAQKIMYNNKVYIIYQGRVYDMTGRQCELK